MDNIKSKVMAAAEYIQARSEFKPEIAIILGSGLGALGETIQKKASLIMDDILHFPETTVEGHAGRLILGILGGRNVVVMQGRFHFYEGHSMHEITFPVRVMKALGASYLIVSNASGGLNPDFKVGDLMLISDHINLMGDNPLIGPHDQDFGPRFPDMSEAYSCRLRKLAKEVGEKLNVPLHEGIYVAVSGPNYETPAELRFFRKIGADAVGMSTVPEVIVANQIGMEVLGISCITDMAIGVDGSPPLDHEHVLEAARAAEPKFISLVNEIVKRL